MKKIILDGRIGANGTEIKVTKTGNNYARFSLANNTFVNGEEKTEWYDVICYDQSFIEKRAQYCGRGTYVIVTGDIRSEVRVDNAGKVWINHHITAITVDTPRVNSKNEQNGNQVSTIPVNPNISTYTGGTKSDYVSQVPQPLTAVISETAVQSANQELKVDDMIPTVQDKPTIKPTSPFVVQNDEDLPF
jgi:single-stranded DNA-binding protein